MVGDDREKEEEQQKKRNCSGKVSMGSNVMGYDLRKNPKKTAKLSEEVGEVDDLDEIVSCMILLATKVTDFSSPSSSAAAAAASVTDDQFSDKNFAGGVVLEEDWAEKVRTRKRRERSGLGNAQSVDPWNGYSWISDGSESRKKIKGNRSQLDRDELRKKKKTVDVYSCKRCKKNFGSYQALGGHRASYKRTKGSCCSPPKDIVEDDVGSQPEASYSISIANSNPTTVDIAPTPAPAPPSGMRRESGHECPICFKVFVSGQALGGHKRAHLANSNITGAGITEITPKQAGKSKKKEKKGDGLILRLKAPAFVGGDNSGSRRDPMEWSTGTTQSSCSMVLSGR